MKILKTLSKRGLALFLVLTMCVSLLPATALAMEVAEATHTHNEDGWTCAEESELICGYEQEHTHDERCWETSEGALVCKLEETEGHQHGEECYAEETVLTCDQEESEEHQHDESCYTTETVLTCRQEETEGHTHGEDCLAAGEKNLVCELDEHQHSDECYKTEWTCTEPTADVTCFLQAVKAIPKEITAQNVEEAEARIAEAIAAHQPLGGSEKTNASVVKAYDAILAAEIAVEAARKGAQTPVLPEDAVVVDPADLVEYNDGSEEEALAVADLFTLVANTYLADEEDPYVVSFPTSLYFVGEDVDERFDFMDAMFAEEQETVALTRDAITWQDVPVTVYFFEKDAMTQDELLMQVGNDNVALLAIGDPISGNKLPGQGHTVHVEVIGGVATCDCPDDKNDGYHGWLKKESGKFTPIVWAPAFERLNFIPPDEGVYVHAFFHNGGNKWMGESAPISVAKSEDLTIAKSVDNANPAVGETVTYTVTITNNGNAASSVTTLTDTFTLDGTEVDRQITEGEGYKHPTGEGFEDLIEIPSISANGGTYSFKYSYKVTSADIGTLVNTIKTLDGKKNASATVTVTEEPVVTYTVTYTDGVDGEEIFADQVSTVAKDSATPPFAGENGATIPTRNGYTFAGWDPTVADTVTADAIYTAQWTETVPAITATKTDGRTGTTSRTYAEGETIHYTITIDKATGEDGNAVDNGLMKNFSITDKYLPENGSAVDVKVNDADAVYVTDKSPSITGTGDSRTLTFELATETTSTVTVEYDYTVTAADVGAGSIVNKASIKAWFNGEEPTTPPTEPEIETPTGSYELSVEKVISSITGATQWTPSKSNPTAPATVKPGSTINYTITVSNSGTAEAKGVKLTDVFTLGNGTPSALTLTSVDEHGNELTDGNALNPDSFTVPAGILNADKTTVTPGKVYFTASYPVPAADVDGALDPDTVIKNSAEVEIGKDTPVVPETPPTIKVEKKAVSIVKTVTIPDADADGKYTVSANGTIEYKIVVKNEGNVELKPLKITDELKPQKADGTLGDALTGVAFTDVNGKIDGTAVTVSYSNGVFTIPALAVGASCTITFKYAVTAANAGQTLVNVATPETGVERVPTDPETPDEDENESEPVTVGKLKISKMEKTLVVPTTEEQKGLLGNVKVEGGKLVVIDNSKPITLLYKITIEGDVGAKFTFEDKDAVIKTESGKAPTEIPVKTDDPSATTNSVEFYVTMTFTKGDNGYVNETNGGGVLGNEATVKPGEGTDPIVPPSKSKAYTVTVNYVPVDANGNTLNNVKLSENGTTELKSYTLLVPVTCTPKVENGNYVKDKDGNYVYDESKPGYELADSVFPAGLKSLADADGKNYALLSVEGAKKQDSITGNVTITAKYSVDEKGGTPENPDKTPDVVQATVTYKVVDGTWTSAVGNFTLNETTKDNDQTLVVTLAEKTWTNSGMTWVTNSPHTLNANTEVPAGTPDKGFAGGVWSVDPQRDENGNVVMDGDKPVTNGSLGETSKQPATVTGDVTFILTHTRNQYPYTVEYYYDNATTPGDVPTGATTGGNAILDDPVELKPWDPKVDDKGDGFPMRTGTDSEYVYDETRPATVVIENNLDDRGNAISGKNVIKVYYLTDVKGGDNGGSDGIPDAYEAFVKYTLADSNKGQLTPAQNESLTKTYDLRETKDDKFVYVKDDQGKDTTEVELKTQITTTGATAVEKVSGQDYAFDYWTYPSVNGATIGGKPIKGMTSGTAALGSETIDGVEGGKTYTFIANYAEDKWHDADPSKPDDKDSETGGDGIPDKYQARITYVPKPDATAGTVDPVVQIFTSAKGTDGRYTDNWTMTDQAISSTATGAKYAFAFWSWNPNDNDLAKSPVAFFGSSLNETTSFSAPTETAPTANDKTLYAIFLPDDNNNQIPDAFEVTVVFRADQNGSIENAGQDSTITRTYDLRIPVKDSSGNVVAGQYELNTDYSIKLKTSIQLGTDAAPAATAAVIAKPDTDYAFDKWELKQNGSETVFETILTKGLTNGKVVEAELAATKTLGVTAVTAGATYTYTAYFAEDVMDKEKPDVPGPDGIPDKYEVTFVFTAGEHGRRADGTPAKLVKVLTDANGSYVERGTSSIVEADNVKAEAYTGYGFDKWTSTDWNPAVTCSSVQLTTSDLSVIGGRTYTFNASFKSLAFTVVLDPNGGTWPENMDGYVKAEDGDTASKEGFAANDKIDVAYPAPKKTGNVFKGWKVNNLKGSSVYTEFPMPVVTMWKAVGSPEDRTITLTAQWEPEKLTYTTVQHFRNTRDTNVKDVYTLMVTGDKRIADYGTPISELIQGLETAQTYYGQQYAYVKTETTVDPTVDNLTVNDTTIHLYYYLDTWKDGDDDPDSDSDKEPDGTPDVDQVLIRYTVDPANAGTLTTALQVETLPSDNKVTAKSTVTPEEDYNFASWSGKDIVATSPQTPALSHSFAAEGGHEYTFNARLQRKLTVNAADVTVYYDGQPHGLTVTVTGAEQYTVKYYKDAAHQQVIGSDPVNVADSGTIYFVVTAADGRYASGSATVTIKPVALTATAKEQTKVYDGEAFDAADLSSDWYTITAQDAEVIGEAAAKNAAEFIEKLKVNASITANCTDVGTYQAAIAFDGIKDQLNDNYTLAEAPADLVITPKPLYVTVTGKTGTVTYNGEEQKVTGYDVVVKDGAGEDAAEVAGIQFHDVTAEAKGTDAGTYAMGLKGTGFTLVSKNYTIAGISVTDGRLKIEPKEVTVTANNAAKAYGQADPTFTAEVNGTIGTDTVKYTLNRERGEAVGTYAITPAGEELQGNYKVSYVPGTLTISNSNVLTVTAGGVHVVYDGVQHTVTANASINGAAITVTYTDANGNVVAAPVNAGTYTAAITATLEGYETARASATVTIDPRPVTITVRDLRDQRYTGRAIGYTGTAHTTDLDDKITFTGLAAGDAITSVNLSGQRTAAGTYRGELTASNAVITRSGVNVTANYSVSYVAGTLSIIVPYDPVIPGGGGGTGGGGTTIPDGPTPLAPDPGTTIEDQEVPLAAPGLNNIDHFDYIKGYVIDGQILVRPEANITRAEVATIFFRLMTKEFREANWATENDFTDVKKGDWYNNAISTCTKAGILKGYEDGSFKPNQTISREEFAAIAARFASEEVPAGGMFKDIAGRWSEKDIERAAAMGWIRGSNGMFRPVDKITRAEVIVIVNRMLDRIPDADHMLPDMKTFPDNTPDMWWYADVQEATNSHEYDRAEDGVTGIWTSLLPEQDWAALEKEWATAADANVADVAPKLGGGAEKLEEETKVPETTGDGDGKAPETTGDGDGEN